MSTPGLVTAATGMLLLVVATRVGDVAPQAGPVSLYLAALGAATGALVLALRRGAPRPTWSPVLLAGMVFLGARALSLLVAPDPTAARETVVGEAKALVLLAVASWLFAIVPRLGPVVALAVAALAALAGLSLVQEFVVGNGTTFGGLSNVPLSSELPGLDARHSGPEADVNFWARSLVLFVPLALSVALSRRGLRRVGWLAAAAVIAAGVYLTQSRGGLLALTVAVIAWLALTVRRPARLALVVVALAGVAAVVPGVGSRLGTLSSVESRSATADQSLVDRAAVQRIGLAMARDHPLLGVGAGNFIPAQPDYRRRVAPELSEPTAPHNVYLEMLAESGLAGLVAWLVLYGAALLAGVRALLLLRGLDGGGPPSAATWLAAGTVSGLVGWAVASLVLHLADFEAVLVVMALAGALDVRARALTGPAPILAAPQGRRRRLPRWRPLAGAIAAVVTVGGLLLLLRPTSTVWTTSVGAVVEPADPAADAYVRDVLSRPTVVTTYAELFRDRGLLRTAAGDVGVDPAEAAVTVDQTFTSAALTVTVSSPDREAARRLAPALVGAVQRYVASLHGLYGIRRTH